MKHKKDASSVAVLSVVALAFMNASFAAETSDAKPTQAKEIVVGACLDAVIHPQTSDASCPGFIVESLQNGEWHAIGKIDAPTMQSVGVITGASGQYGMLRVGCSRTIDCVENWYYVWDGNAYEQSYVEVRGHRVNVADSIHGLYTLLTITRLLSIPEGGANFVARYPGDTEVTVIGTSEKGDYYYVSPCNACESGFVEKSAVRPR